jgi:hypothetical protein
MNASLSVKASEVDIEFRKSDIDAYAKSPLMWLDIDCGDAEMSIWIDPKDLARIAGLLRSASEAIEALVEPKVKPALRLVQSERQAA